MVNAENERQVRPSFNTQGFTKVGLWVGTRQVTRSVAMLVLDTFEPSYDPQFNSVIHLDGNRANCQLSNLMRRPRWFSIRYHSQLRDGHHYDTSRSRVRVLGQDEIMTFREAAMKYGVLYYDVLKSAVEGDDVYPVRRLFFEFVRPSD